MLQPFSAAADLRLRLLTPLLTLVFLVMAFEGERSYSRLWFPIAMALVWCLCPGGLSLSGLNRPVATGITMLIGYAVLQLLPLGFGPGPWGTLTVSPASTASHVLRLAGYVLVFLLVRRQASDPGRNAWELAYSLLLVLCLEAGLGIFQRLIVRSGEFAVGTYVDHSHFASLLAMGFPFAVTSAVIVGKRSLAGDVVGIAPALRTCGFGAMAALVLAGILLAASRSAFLCMLISLVIAGGLQIIGSGVKVNRVGALAVMSCALAVLATLLVTKQMADRFEKLSTPEKISVEAPIRLWRNGFKVFEAFPVTGCGLGAYWAGTKKVIPREQTNVTHSDALQALAELGVVGAALATKLGAAVFRMAFDRSVRLPDARARSLAIACFAGLAAGLLNSIVENNLYVPANAILFCWIAGISAGLADRPRLRYSPVGRRVVRSAYA